MVETCLERGVGRINFGKLEDVREDENGNSRNWGKHGNLDLHGWALGRFANILEYKSKVEGIEVREVDERDTSKTYCVCGTEDKSQAVERGLYVCEECDSALSADVNGVENIRLDMNKSNSESVPDLGGDRSTGWLALSGDCPVTGHTSIPTVDWLGISIESLQTQTQTQTQSQS